MKLTNYKKKKITEYFLILLLTLFSARGNIYFIDIKYSIIPIVIFTFIFHKKKINIKKNDLRIFLVFTLFIIAYFLKYHGEFDPAFTFRLFGYVYLAYLTLKIVGANFFQIYEDIIFYLALISLPLFLIEIISYNFLYSILLRIQPLIMIPLATMDYSNIYFFTLNKGQIRNCGFAWEPGAFSQFLILALIINLARNKFNIKNIRFWILIIVILTTLSTTGYLALVIVSIWFIYNKKISKRLILIPILIVIIIYAFSLTFMYDKIIELSRDPIYSFESKFFASYNSGISHTLGRFQGLVLNIKDFLNHPFIGYGGHSELTLSRKLDINIFSINGLGKWLARYGAIGFLLMIYLYSKSFNNLATIYNFKKPLLLMGVLFVLGFSYGLLESPLFFTFMMSFLLVSHRGTIREINNYEK